jgi:hypothetical protein
MYYYYFFSEGREAARTNSLKKRHTGFKSVSTASLGFPTLSVARQRQVRQNSSCSARAVRRTHSSASCWSWAFKNEVCFQYSQKSGESSKPQRSGSILAGALCIFSWPSQSFLVAAITSPGAPICWRSIDKMPNGSVGGTHKSARRSSPSRTAHCPANELFCFARYPHIRQIHLAPTVQRDLPIFTSPLFSPPRMSHISEHLNTFARLP